MATTFKKMPADTFRFAAPIAFAESDGDRPKMRIKANSGQPFDHGMYGVIVLDMETGTIPSQTLNILREHEPTRIVGKSETVTKDNSFGIQVVAVPSRVTADGIEVEGLLREGQPLEASVYVPSKRVEEVAAGNSITVNGRSFAGPGMVLRDWTLREVSVCALGADPNTRASFAYRHGDQSVMVEVELNEDEQTKEETMPEDEKKIDQEQPPAEVESTEPASQEAPAPDPQPAGNEEVVHEDRAAAIVAERERCKSIMQKAEALGLKTMGLELIDKGSDLKDATLALQERRLQILTTPRQDEPTPNGEPIESKSVEPVFASVDEEIAWKWENDPKVRDTFGEQKYFAAWLKHEKLLANHPNSKRNKGV